MNTLQTVDTTKVNTYSDLRGYGLSGTPYKWVFKVYPTYNNHHFVKVLLKPLTRFSMFRPSRYTADITVNMAAGGFEDTMCAALDLYLSVEHVKRIIGDVEA